jgi:chromosomal replication initiator protein
MFDHKTLWENALTEIELSTSKANFTMWFKDTFIVKIDGGVTHLGVPSVFVKDWLFNKYHKFILKSLRTFNEHIRALEYIVVSREDSKKQTDKHPSSISTINELPLHEHYINKEDNLNPRYTFETFVVGPFNELAHAASQAILKNPVTYNPLFIYGNTGHGKTHLIQAVGNQFKKNHPDKKTFYLSSEKFALDYVNALNVGKDKINQFKEKYRQYDFLIIDDIQFFSKKERTQEEFFHLFNHFYDNNKQIIFSSDKHPNYIPDLEDRIKSRLNAGMIVEIPNPDLESRIQIFKTKSRLLNFELTNDVIEYLASSIEGNIREIEGVINSIICQSQLKGRALSVGEIKNLIKNNTKAKRNVSVKDVVKAVATFYGIEESTVYEKSRKKEVVKPRQIIMYLLREDFNISYPSIGEKMGGRDHTTVIHSCDKIKADIKSDPVLATDLSQIRAMLDS